MLKKQQKRVLAIVGSPRKGGNSDTLCDRVLAGAKRAGAVVEKVVLGDLDIRPCRACMACRKKRLRHCVMDDDMAPLYPKLRQCDALVIASPIYFLNLSAQTVLFLNRLYPLFNPDECALGARRVVACFAYGDEDPIGSGCDIAARVVRDLFASVEVPTTFVHASALKRGEIKTNKAALRKAWQAGGECAS